MIEQVISIEPEPTARKLRGRLYGLSGRSGSGADLLASAGLPPAKLVDVAERALRRT